MIRNEPENASLIAEMVRRISVREHANARSTAKPDGYPSLADRCRDDAADILEALDQGQPVRLRVVDMEAYTIASLEQAGEVHLILGSGFGG